MFIFNKLLSTGHVVCERILIYKLLSKNKTVKNVVIKDYYTLRAVRAL